MYVRMKKQSTRERRKGETDRKRNVRKGGRERGRNKKGT